MHKHTFATGYHPRVPSLSLQCRPCHPLGEPAQSIDLANIQQHSQLPKEMEQSWAQSTDSIASQSTRTTEARKPGCILQTSNGTIELLGCLAISSCNGKTSVLERSSPILRRARWLLQFLDHCQEQTQCSRTIIKARNNDEFMTRLKGSL